MGPCGVTYSTSSQLLYVEYILVLRNYKSFCGKKSQRLMYGVLPQGHHRKIGICLGQVR